MKLKKLENKNYGDCIKRPLQRKRVVRAHRGGWLTVINRPACLLLLFFLCASLAPLSLAECVKKNYGFLEMLMPTGSRRFLAPNNSFGALKSHFSQRSGERKKEARYATPSTCRSVPLGFSSTALVVSSTWCPVPLQPTVLRSTPPSPSSKMKCPFAHYVK